MMAGAKVPAGGVQHPQLRLMQQRPQCAAVVTRSAAREAGMGASSRPSIAPVAMNITKQITRASSTVELLQLHAAYRGQLDALHYAAFFNKALQISDSDAAHHSRQHHMQYLEDWHQQQTQHPLLQQQHLQQQQLHPEVLRQQLLQALLADIPLILHSMQPGPLVVVLRALAKLEVQPLPQLLQAMLHHAHQRLGFQAFSPRELCTLAHALTELQPLPLPWTTTAQAAVPAGSDSPAAPSSAQQHSRAMPNTSSSSSNSGDGWGSAGGTWEPVLLQELFCALGLCLPRGNAQDAAQAVLAVARLRYAPSEAWLRLWLLRATQLLPHFTPQGLANAAYGLVRALELRGLLPSSSSCELPGNTTSTSSSSSSDSRENSNPIQASQQQQQQQQSSLLAAAQAWLQSCLKVSVLHRHSMQPQELLGQLLWAAGKLSCPPPQPAWHHLMTSAQAMLPRCDVRHLCAALYTFALLGHSPDQAGAAALWSRLAHQASHITPMDLDQVLWSAGKLQLQPPQHVRVVLQRRALVLLKQPQSPRHVVGVLRGMVGMGWRLQRRYVVRFQAALLEQLECCVPQDFANTLWALATARVAVEPRWLDRVLMGSCSSLDQFSPQDLANTLWALAQLQHQPSKPWLQQLLLASLQIMSHFKAADHVQILWGLSDLGFTPSPLWLSSFWSRSGQSLARCLFEAAELHVLLLAAVKLELQPPAKWVQAAAAAVEGGLAGFGSQQLLETLRALQQLWQVSSAADGGSTGSSLQTLQLSSSRSRSLQWSSSMRPLSSPAGLRLHGLKVVHPKTSADKSITVGTRAGGSSSSSSSSIELCPAGGSPGVLRLYRQLSPTALAGSITISSSPGFASTGMVVEPTCNGSRTGSSSSSSSLLLQRQQQQALRPRDPQQQQQQQQQHWRGLAATHSAANARRHGDAMHAQGSGLAPIGVHRVCADEAYSLACLVLLMPPRVRDKLERWPQLLAESRTEQQQQQLQAAS